jgi:hypothetical protein
MSIRASKDGRTFDARRHQHSPHPEEAASFDSRPRPEEPAKPTSRRATAPGEIERDLAAGRDAQVVADAGAEHGGEALDDLGHRDAHLLGHLGGARPNTFGLPAQAGT